LALILEQHWEAERAAGGSAAKPGFVSERRVAGDHKVRAKAHPVFTTLPNTRSRETSGAKLSGSPQATLAAILRNRTLGLQICQWGMTEVENITRALSNRSRKAAGNDRLYQLAIISRSVILRK
jgi:hypothetical protein